MSKKLLGAVFILGAIFVSSVSVAHAVTPTLSLLALGDGDSVQLNITGDANASVFLDYTKSGTIGLQITSVGTTNSNGTLTTTVSSSQYGIVSDSLVHVTLDNINGPISANVTWPPVSSLISSTNMLSLSQTGVVLPIGQSITITASNMSSGSLYLSSNSNPQIANVSLSGSQITVSANSYGSTVAAICLTTNSSNCSSVYITVQNSSAQPLTFSQNSVSLSPGQSLAIQVSGGTGSYIVSNNSSQSESIVQTSISGSTITLSTNSSIGSSSITVCSSDMSSCGIINVTIGSASYSSVSFSQSNPTVTVGQSINVSVYGPSSSLFYVASNSNPSIVQANLTGSTLTLLGITGGSSTVSVCASANNCGSITVTASYNSTSTGARLMLSQDSVSLLGGQTISITISGGTMPYTIYSNANSIFEPTLNTNILSLYGVASGASSMNVCSADGECDTLSVSVNGINSTSPALAITSLSPGVLVNQGQTVVFSVFPSGFSPTSYFLTDSFSGTSISSANINSSGYFSWTPGANDVGTHVINVTAVDNAGHSASAAQTITVQSSTAPVSEDTSAGCAEDSAYNTITGQSCPNYVAPAPVVSVPVATIGANAGTNSIAPVATKVPILLKSGSTGEEVIALQKKLKSLGFYKGKIDGGFGPATEKAVKAFQKAHKLTQDGVVGSGTGSALGL